MRLQIAGLAGKPFSPVMLPHRRRLTALWSQALELPHCLAGMSTNSDPETLARHPIQILGFLVCTPALAEHLYLASPALSLTTT